MASHHRTSSSIGTYSYSHSSSLQAKTECRSALRTCTSLLTELKKFRGRSQALGYSREYRLRMSVVEAQEHV